MNTRHTTPTQPASSSFPAQSAAELDAKWAAYLHKEDETCKGYSHTIRAALVGLVCRAHPTVRASQLMTLGDAKLWTLALAAHAGSVLVLRILPEAMTKLLTEGETHAINAGIRWGATSLPTGAGLADILSTARDQGRITFHD